MTFPFPITNAYRPAATVTYTDLGYDESNLSSYTFSTKSFGTASSDRRMIVGVSAPANTNFGTITGMTIGGVTATQLVQTEDADGYSDFAIYGADVPTGATGDVVVTLSASPDRCGIAIFATTGILSLTPTDTGTVNTASVDLTDSINVSSGGIIVGFVSCENASNAWTWTNLTERVDDIITSASSASAASDAYASAQSVSVTAATTGTKTRQGLLLVAMR